MSRKRLEKIGFVRLTTWGIRNGKLKPANIFLPDRTSCLYAFVIGRTVKYVGLTKGKLISRMDHYSYSPQEPNARIRENILEALQAGKSVAILGRVDVPPGDLEREESRLIRELRPQWNRT